ncbi:hypothetical protein ACFP3O_31620 [Paraburkholderia silvatlantica]|uniref:Uncharacterized protein n=2 Tax=Paraburkholderia silvatlantica TaxID=321895 RepID=A0ABR6FYG2_9BURK|nr:hypothetical protein [Paraburkholderia silvatlantica]MBB2932470.1 hypothetical protein [Paraburkholderia silvatlantica]
MAGFFDGLVSKISSMSKDDIKEVAEKRATISDLSISHFDSKKHSAVELAEASEDDKRKFLANTLAFRVAEFYPVDVNKLSQQLEEDKPLALSEKSAITTKMKLK